MNAIETTHRGKVDKVQRYGWTFSDEPGHMQMIPKAELHVDRAYQRDVSGHDAKVNRIAAEWSWVACGAIIVGRRGGRFFVIDGQHRVLAALKRSDIQSLPCIVFETETQGDEATGFIRANRNRKPMTAIQSFRAEVLSGSDSAIKVQKMVEEAGLQISKCSGAGTFSAVGALKKAIETDEKAMARAWPFIVAVFSGSSIHNAAIRGAHYLERRLAGETLADRFWIARGVKIGRDEIMRAMNNAVAYRGASGEAAWADGIMQALNKGQRSRTLRIE